ncbi:DUF2326 domain-containing protein [Azospirillaceae bacterium]
MPADSESAGAIKLCGVVIATARSDPINADAKARLRLTRFDFRHKVFTATGGYFALSQDDQREPVFIVPLGESSGVVPLHKLCDAFDILPYSHDGKLLDLVIESLKYIKVIRPGETIPGELLDGTASWAIEDRHRIMGMGRITLCVVSWVSGEQFEVHNEDDMECFLRNPDVKARVLEAMPALATILELGQHRIELVQARLDGLGHELSYIEALREEFGKVRAMQEKMVTFQAIYRRDRNTLDEISQTLRLMAKPLAEIDRLFGQVDFQMADVPSLFRVYDAQVDLFRTLRDQIHVKLLEWEHLIDVWADVPVECCSQAINAMRETYRFLAQRYVTTKVWQRNS